MRSSSKLLAASRSEGDGVEDGNVPNVATPRRQNRRDEFEFNELEIRLKISYKTLVFAFVLFDVLRKLVDVTADSNSIQNLF
jgi:hypothetical protein